MPKVSQIIGERGAVLPLTLVIVVVLGTVGFTMTTSLTDQVEAHGYQTSHDQAYYTSMAGMEYALMKAKANQAFSTQSFAGGNFTYAESGRTVTVNGNKYAAKANHSLNMDGSGNAENLVPVVPGNVGTGNPDPDEPNDNKSILNLGLSNTGGAGITVDQIYISTSNAGRKLQAISIAGVVVASFSVAGTTLPATINITNTLIPSGGSLAIDYLTFDGSMQGETVTIQYILSDGSTRTVQLTNLQQAQGCFSVNTTSVGTGTPSYQQPNDHRAILNITVANSCPTSVVLDTMYISTSNNGKKLQSIAIDNATVFSAGASGMVLPGIADINDVTFASGATKAVNWIEFNGNMRELDVYLEFIATDGSRNTVQINDLEEAY